MDALRRYAGGDLANLGPVRSTRSKFGVCGFGAGRTRTPLPQPRRLRGYARAWRFISTHLGGLPVEFTLLNISRAVERGELPP
jgi:hypothetical protein